MTLVLRSTGIETALGARVPVGLVPPIDLGRRTVADSYRYRSIGSLTALALAIAAAAVTPALLRLAL